MVGCVPRIELSGLDCSWRRIPARLGASALALALAMTIASPASAQFFFNDGAGGSKKPGAALQKKRQKATNRISRAAPEADGSATGSTAGSQKTKSGDKQAIDKKPEGPLLISVSLRRQRVSVYDQTGLLTEAPISSGKFSPTGIYSVLDKNKVHFSNLYDSAPMPNMQRITWSGVALHAGPLPGYPASHGCIRLPHGFSQKLFGLTSLGTRVIVSNETVQPAPFSHARLFAAYPAEGSTTTHALMPAGVTKVADASDQQKGPPREVGSVIGVSTALAAETSPLVQIEALRQERRKELEKIARAVTDAENVKASAIEAAKAAVKEVDEAKTAARTARQTAERLAQAARKAAQERDAAEKKLEAFERGLSKKSSFTPEDTAKAASDEDALEAAAMDLSDKADAAKAEADKAAAAREVAETALEAADPKRVQAVNAVHEADKALTEAREADAAAKRREAKRNSPVHVFISRKTQKLYVRQGYEPILEVPVSITDPDRPMGTHIFTALAVDPTKAGSLDSVNWSVASIPTYSPSKPLNARDRKQREAAAAEAALSAAEAIVSLFRGEWPAEKIVNPAVRETFRW